jgi:hypothetical protein
MRASRLVFVLGLAAPSSMGLAGCFITAEGERYEDAVGSTGQSECVDNEIGSEGCPCTMGGSCNPGFFCNTNLQICISDTCPVGTEKCHCTPGGQCDPGLQCLSDFCVDPGPQCPVGTEACPCTPGGGCDNGLTCLSQTCVNTDELTTSGADPTTDDPGTSSEGADTTAAADSSSTGMPDPDTSGTSG